MCKFEFKTYKQKKETVETFEDSVCNGIPKGRRMLKKAFEDNAECAEFWLHGLPCMSRFIPATNAQKQLSSLVSKRSSSWITSTKTPKTISRRDSFSRLLVSKLSSTQSQVVKYRCRSKHYKPLTLWAAFSRLLLV